MTSQPGKQKIDLTFLIKSFFLHDKNVKKTSNILKTNIAFNVKKKYFSSFLKGYSLKQIKKLF